MIVAAAVQRRRFLSSHKRNAIGIGIVIGDIGVSLLIWNMVEGLVFVLKQSISF